MADFNDMNSIAVDEAKSNIAFNVMRDPIITESGIKANKDLIVKTDGQVPLGIVSKNHTLIPYGDSMDFITSELAKNSVDYKIRESLIMPNGNMYQEYVLDMPMGNPDGQMINPMIIAHGSYKYQPLKIIGGTFRFVCSNGIMVGETIKSIAISANSGPNVLQSSITDELASMLQKFNTVSQKYVQLAEENYNKLLASFIMVNSLSVNFKQVVMAALVEKNLIKMKVEQLNNKSLEGKTASQVFKHETGAEFSAWEFYNVLTDVATHKVSSAQTRTHVYRVISKMFGV